MKINKKFKVAITLGVMAVVLGACGGNKAINKDSDSVKVATTTKAKKTNKKVVKKAAKADSKKASEKTESKAEKSSSTEKKADTSAQKAGAATKSQVEAPARTQSAPAASSSSRQNAVTAPATSQKTPNTPAPAQPKQPASNSSSTNVQQPQQIVLGVPYISQGSTMLCEGTSLLEALHYKGVTNQSLMSFVNLMPRASDNNPYNGFAGEWRHNVNGTYQGMMAGPVVQWAAKAGGRATQISGPGAIKNALRNGNPVVAWIVYGFESPQFKQMSWGRAVWNSHVVCVDGFKANGYHIVDPNAGSYWVTASAFEYSNSVSGMAVSVG
ncbi:C39 family peptidase [Lapidilactobacillus luobeiensis]|uniref:C39 family peptidase n=1 Tax=Lapidilactobacillus luobeiensis TaxID=2950371 RepID=UPI0021C2B9AB|nr:C39 family peptidase [Lapidilactobacillus luobeiensis]